jgi:hypothetical protein
MIKCPLDLAQTSLREDPLDKGKIVSRHGNVKGRASKIPKDRPHTFVLMFVIFLIAQPSPVRLCLAATTQP